MKVENSERVLRYTRVESHLMARMKLFSRRDLGKKIPHKIPHTSTTQINQTNSNQHDCLDFHDTIDQNDTPKRYGTRS
jgi:hypothetical protein